MDKKNSKQKRIRGVVLWLVCLVLLILAGAGTFVVLNTYFKKDKTIIETSEDLGEENEEIEAVEEVKIDEISEGVDETNGGKKVTQYEGADPNKSEELTGVITYAGAVGENLMIRTNIDQYLGEGTCELAILQNGNIIYSATVEIAAEASTSSCQGFDVPLAGLGNGNYQINIKLSSGGKVGTINGEANL